MLVKDQVYNLVHSKVDRFEDFTQRATSILRKCVDNGNVWRLCASAYEGAHHHFALTI
jgi:hypothetical protein